MQKTLIPFSRKINLSFMQTPHSNEVHIDVPIFRLQTWPKKTSFMSLTVINIYAQITVVEQGQIIVINTHIQEGKELEIHSHYWSSQLWNFVEQALWRPLPILLSGWKSLFHFPLWFLDPALWRYFCVLYLKWPLLGSCPVFSACFPCASLGL